MDSGIGATLTTFATQMLGLSIAAERVTENIKQWWNSRSAQPPATLDAAAQHTANFQLIAFASGVFVVTLAHVDPLTIVAQWGWVDSPHYLVHHAPRIVSIGVTGLLVSGGSSVWNHILDILKASKVTTEETANTTLAAASKPPIPA